MKKPKNVELGPRVTLDDERCILCSRCIRFSKEIAHDDVLGFIDRGSYTTLTAHPGRRLENNYSLNTVDICPVGALTSSDFRFKMRVWFLKETKSFCTSCATGCNTIIGTREDVIYRQTPRENDAVNSCWMCDYGRLNFDYLQSERRLLEPLVREQDKLQPATWKHAIETAAAQLKPYVGGQIAILASGRMTNEELWLTSRLAKSLGTSLIDIVPRTGAGRRHPPERRSQPEHERRPAPAASPPKAATILRADQGSDLVRANQGADFVRRESGPLRDHGGCSGAVAGFHRDGFALKREHRTGQRRSAVVRLRRETRFDDQRQRPSATAQSRGARPRPGAR